jgi:hypothetical protein
LQNENSYLAQKKESLEKLLESYDAEFRVVNRDGAGAGGSSGVTESGAKVASLQLELQAAESQIQQLRQRVEDKATPSSELAVASKRTEDLELSLKESEKDKAKLLKQVMCGTLNYYKCCFKQC